MKRYEMYGNYSDVEQEEDSEGSWVKHEDVEALEKEVEALRQDAARYRWLRNDPPLSLSVRRFPGETQRGCYLDDVNLDDAIDAAMKEPQP